MFVRFLSTKPKPKMKPIELKTPPEQIQTITRVIFDIVKEDGPLTVADSWERVKVCVSVKLNFNRLVSRLTKPNNLKQAKSGNDPSPSQP
ncbi:hypothetical protein WN944_006784 [Citrus x changshan-huyou]|uniref:Uncharacterized protein n=1 Tax=Citrus x changshan-huyou TaxID=2935761 RepID=A0AAP0QTT2_9ROSI